MKNDDSVESMVRAASKGDRAAFKRLYERYHQSVFRTAYRLVGDRMHAEDVTQDVFETIYKKLSGFEFQSQFHTWCYRITVNACYDRMRKQKRRAKYHTGPIEPDSYESNVPSLRQAGPEEIVNRKEFAELINRKLETLPDELKTAFVLREFEQLGYREIAEIMKCSEGTVASRLARARGHLAEYLNKFGIDNSHLK